jgi:hypothetical protein
MRERDLYRRNGVRYFESCLLLSGGVCDIVCPVRLSGDIVYQSMLTFNKREMGKQKCLIMPRSYYSERLTSNTKYAIAPAR